MSNSDISIIRISCAENIMIDPYGDTLSNGNIILVDYGTNGTVASGVIGE